MSTGVLLAALAFSLWATATSASSGTKLTAGVLLGLAGLLQFMVCLFVIRSRRREQHA
jgi:hypothetical protein